MTVKNLAYWKGRERDALVAYRYASTDEFRKAWLFAIAKIQKLEYNAFNLKGKVE
jgi:hypothetical protein